MREIKFRYVYKHSKTGEIKYAVFTLDEIEVGGSIWNEVHDWVDDGYLFEARDEYTGLKDSKGNEVYESDALYAEGNLEGEEFIGFVEWDKEDARFEVVSIHGRFEYIPNGCYVKGNRFEHPHLLEGEQA